MSKGLKIIYALLVVGFIVIVICGIKIFYGVIERNACYNLPVSDFYKRDECKNLLKELEE